MKRHYCLFLLIVFLVNLRVEAKAFSEHTRECDPTIDKINVISSSFISTSSKLEGLLYFEARIEGEEVFLDWEVQGDFDTKSFVLERRTGDHFEFIGSIREAEGERDTYRKYSFKDEFESHLAPFRQYRLKQKFLDGTYIYHKPILISLFPSQDFNAYPTRVSNMVNLKLPEVRASYYTITFFNISGVVLKESKVPVQTFGQIESFDLSTFPSGMLLVRVQAAEEVWEEKLIKD